MRMLQWIALSLVMLSLLPWATHFGAAGQASAAQATAAAQHMQAAAPHVKTSVPATEARARDGSCRNSLHPATCHLDCLPQPADGAAGQDPLPCLLLRAGSVLAAGRGALPIDRPPISL